jgi:fused signal recognition particle receptor
MLKRLKQGLQNLFLGKKKIDAALFEELETLLLSADTGVATTQFILQALTEQVSRRDLKEADALYEALRHILLDLLKPYEKTMEIKPAHKPFVILFIGINGAGKTTTIGKLAKKLQSAHQKVLLAAGDTFRAAAVDQLQVWGERNQIPVISQAKGADSAAVIFDAINAAKARNIDVVIADTAGRLHTQQHLLEELKKIKRVISRVDGTAPHEVLLVLDASIGQNALTQAKQFHEALGVTGLVLTKLDGTAKGGAIFSIIQSLQLPVYYMGVGENIQDLQPFQAEAFLKLLLD